jgi:hypothetical protein
VENASIEVLFDDCPSLDWREAGIAKETFDRCVDNPPYRCGLGRIYLLHALQQSSTSQSLDVFLILKQIAPVDGKSNCYSRIGLMRLANGGLNMRNWSEIIDGKTIPRQETFWLF